MEKSAYKQMIPDKSPACMYVLVGVSVCVCVGLSDYGEKYGRIPVSF